MAYRIYGSTSIISRTIRDRTHLSVATHRFSGVLSLMIYDRSHETVRLLRNANGKDLLKQFTISYAHGHMHGIPNVALSLDSATSITYAYMLKSTNPIHAGASTHGCTMLQQCAGPETMFFGLLDPDNL